MKGSLGATNARGETLSSLSKIFNDMERMIHYFIGYKRGNARWSGALAGALVWFIGIIGLIVVNSFTGMSVTEYFIEHEGSNLVYFGFLVALSLPIGLATYSVTEKSFTKDYISWRNTLDGLKKAVAENKVNGTSIIERTLQLMHQAAVWLPNLVRYKSEEAFIYGLVASILTAFLISPMGTPITLPLGVVVWTGTPIALLVGVIVWLHFRNKKRKEADQQIRKLEAWKQKLEEGEDNFLKSV